MRREPLARSSQFRTGDLDLIRDIGGRVLVPHRVDAFGPVSANARMNAARLRSTTLAYLRYESQICLDAPTTEATYFFTIPLTGKAEAVRCKHEVTTSMRNRGVAFRAGEHGRITFGPDYTMLFVRIERHALEHELEGLLGREIVAPLCFDFDMDLTSTRLRTWVDSIGLLRAELERAGDSDQESLLAARIEELVMTSLLVGQPHNYADLLNRSHGPARPRGVKRAIDLMEEQPDQPWSLSALSRATKVSARTLQEGFQRHVGVSPTAYLRGVRLQRVRAELSDPAADTSVADTAYRWGFGHPGRFAAAYRDKFGELPSETLRKARR